MDHVKAASEYVAGHQPGDVHPDVAAAMHRFTVARDGGGDTAVAAHAKALVDMVALVGDDYEPPAPVEKPAKKSAARRTAKKSSSARARKRS